ncbi:MAG: prolyl oligopeptidase family serine peptidase, partial [Clostridia bacterium]|nr:prolyl oligopeptidase family serine peptidase [Clostridia bacterium]
APQLFHWSQADWGSPYQGDYIDTNFRQLGGSKTAFHIYAITRAIDYLLETGKIDPNRIGMAGLSYGGMYTLVTAAVEPRIKVAVSSCYINDRAKYAWNDWSYPGQANTFFDAELFTLIAPRHIFAEAGKNDPIFSVDGVQEVIDEVAYYTAKMGLPEDFYHIRLFDGNHQFFCDGESLSYLFKYL